MDGKLPWPRLRRFEVLRLLASSFFYDCLFEGETRGFLFSLQSCLFLYAVVGCVQFQMNKNSLFFLDRKRECNEVVARLTHFVEAFLID
jgi:hypothetical protein